MKIGRNDPCPCGSGKKQKKCCGAYVPPVIIGTGDYCGGSEIVDYDEDLKRAHQNILNYTAELLKRGVVLPR